MSLLLDQPRRAVSLPVALTLLVIAAVLGAAAGRRTAPECLAAPAVVDEAALLSRLHASTRTTTRATTRRTTRTETRPDGTRVVTDSVTQADALSVASTATATLAVTERHEEARPPPAWRLSAAAGWRLTERPQLAAVPPLVRVELARRLGSSPVAVGAWAQRDNADGPASERARWAAGLSLSLER